MVGDARDFAKAEPAVARIGPSGSGQLTKMNQMCIVGLIRGSPRRSTSRTAGFDIPKVFDTTFKGAQCADSASREKFLS